MKNVTCRRCGETRPSNDADENCPSCESEGITFNPGRVAELLNSRETAEIRCASCNNELWNLDIDAYGHSNGWKVPGLSDKWWLSIACPACNYETSFDKFGVSR